MSSPVIQRKGVFHCGACHHVLKKRSSHLMHMHLRQEIYVCTNPLCSASYSGHSQLTGLTSPSGLPNAPVCELPPTPACQRALVERAQREAMNDGQLDIFDSPPAS